MLPTDEERFLASDSIADNFLHHDSSTGTFKGIIMHAGATLVEGTVRKVHASNGTFMISLKCRSDATLLSLPTKVGLSNPHVILKNRNAQNEVNCTRITGIFLRYDKKDHSSFICDVSLETAA